MKPRLLLFTAACMLFAACGNSRGDLSTGIIPAPQQVAWGDGAFRMPSTLLFATNLEGQAKADLEAWMRRSGDGFFPVSFAEAAGDDIPVLYLLLAEGGAPESYRLDVARGKITVTGARCRRTLLRTSVAGPAGRTLRPPDSGRCDRGRSAFRLPGLHARRLAPLPRQGVRQAAAGPLGPLQIQPLPLAPDRRAGWRIEIKKYPVLTDIAHGGPIPTGRGGTSAANATAAATIRRPMAATIRRTKSARWSNTPAPCISR